MSRQEGEEQEQAEPLLTSQCFQNSFHNTSVYVDSSTKWESKKGTEYLTGFSGATQART